MTDIQTADEAPKPQRRKRRTRAQIEADEAPKVAALETKADDEGERRPSRKRRRRRNTNHLLDVQLQVYGEKDPNFEYRFIRANEGRVQQLTKNDDYDVVQGQPDVIGKTSGERMLLVRKPKDFYEEDQARKQKFLDQRTAPIKRGVPKKKNEDSAKDEEAYYSEGNVLDD